MLMEQARSGLHLPNKETSVSRRCHIFLSSNQKTSAQFPTVPLILFSLHLVMHLAVSTKTPENTKNWNLIVENFPHVVYVRTDNIIHSFEADIEQSLHFLRFALHILGI